MKQKFGSTLSSEWKFVTAVCLPNLEIPPNTACCVCSHYILDKEKMLHIEPWIEEMTDSVRKYRAEEFQTEYEFLLQQFLGYLSKHKSMELDKLLKDPRDHSRDTAEKLSASSSWWSGENLEGHNLNLLLRKRNLESAVEKPNEKPID